MDVASEIRFMVVVGSLVRVGFKIGVIRSATRSAWTGCKAELGPDALLLSRR